MFRKAHLLFSLGLLFSIALFTTAVFGPSLLLILMYLSLVTGIVLTNRYLFSPTQARKQAGARMQIEAVPGVSTTVSLTPRGVLEADDCEERLTLFEAITETALTEKFLSAKDKRGGVLLIPLRAFGSAAAATAFHMELENRRLRQSVGLAPTHAPVETALPTPVAPTRTDSAGQPWWRSAPKAESESLKNRQH
jgi:hypothetical protein